MCVNSRRLSVPPAQSSLGASASFPRSREKRRSQRLRTPVITGANISVPFLSSYPSTAQLVVLKPALMNVSLNLLWPGNLCNWLRDESRGNHHKGREQICSVVLIALGHVHPLKVHIKVKKDQNSSPSSNFLWYFLLWHNVKRFSRCQTSTGQIFRALLTDGNYLPQPAARVFFILFLIPLLWLGKMSDISTINDPFQQPPGATDALDKKKMVTTVFKANRTRKYPDDLTVALTSHTCLRNASLLASSFSSLSLMSCTEVDSRWALR